jgi:enoyl-CoA hydratase/carnithine racemase
VSAVEASMQRVTVDRRGAVAHVRLSRPEKRNALDLAMFEALVAAGAAAATDRTLRAVVLSGDGPAFCAGLDWGSFLASGSDGAERLLARDPAVSPANLAQRAAWIWRELPVPVFAAVRGACLGGGLQLALAADVRYAAPDARLALREIAYGIVPDMTATRTLCRLVRPDVARELVYTGARGWGADEAWRLGLVTHLVDDPIGAAMAAATAVAAQSPDAVRAGQGACSARWRTCRWRAALALETEVQRGLLGTRNQLEAVTAAMQKRAPVFEDR